MERVRGVKKKNERNKNTLIDRIERLFSSTSCSSSSSSSYEVCPSRCLLAKNEKILNPGRYLARKQLATFSDLVNFLHE
jgi:hypothetical protein